MSTQGEVSSNGFFRLLITFITNSSLKRKDILTPSLTKSCLANEDSTWLVPKCRQKKCHYFCKSLKTEMSEFQVRPASVAPRLPAQIY